MSNILKFYPRFLFSKHWEFKIDNFILLTGPKKTSLSSSSSAIKPVMKKRLRELLKTEVEFYEWIKSRLLNSTIENGWKKTLLHELAYSQKSL